MPCNAALTMLSVCRADHAERLRDCCADAQLRYGAEEGSAAAEPAAAGTGAGLLPDLPLWRVQWATLPGTQVSKSSYHATWSQLACLQLRQMSMHGAW